MPSLPPKLDANLVLIGGRGCGKSSIARRLAKRNKQFVLLSLDALIQYEATASIPEIVAERGWAGFRDLEFAVVERACRFVNSALLDCGGGVVVDVDEREREVFSRRKVDALRRNGGVVYLQRDTDYLARRIAGDPNRPSLSDQSSFAEIMERRDPWYRQAADLVLECGERPKDDLAEEVLSWFVGRGPGGCGRGRL